jgi:hypothetical protein
MVDKELLVPVFEISPRGGVTLGEEVRGGVILDDGSLEYEHHSWKWRPEKQWSES